MTGEALVRNAVFSDPIPVVVPKDMAAMALDFARSMSGDGQSHAYYSRRRGANPETVAQNNIDAKIGECAASRFLAERHGFPPAAVDWDVRNGGGKGWEPDLKYPAPYPTVHVKTTPRRYGGRDMSWTFQLCDSDGKRGTDRLFEKIEGFSPGTFRSGTKGSVRKGYEDLVVCVYLPGSPSPSTPSTDATDVTAFVSAVLWWKDIVEEGVLKDPVLPRLLGIKLCIYLDDMAAMCNRVNVEIETPSAAVVLPHSAASPAAKRRISW